MTSLLSVDVEKEELPVADFMIYWTIYFNNAPQMRHPRLSPRMPLKYSDPAITFRVQYIQLINLIHLTIVRPSSVQVFFSFFYINYARPPFRCDA